MSGEFVADYVQGCLEKGVHAPADIRKCAEEEISKINEDIQKIEDLRDRQGNLRAVIRHMGGGTKTKKTSSQTMDFSMDWDDLDESFRELCISICHFIQSHGEGKSPRDIMDVVSDPREHKAVYSAIKWLDHNDVIGRRDTDDGRAIVKAKGWESFVVQIMGESRIL